MTETNKIFPVPAGVAAKALIDAAGFRRMYQESVTGLDRFWRAQGRSQQFLGDLLNAWIAAGEPVSCDHTGTHYWDIGTPAGYQRALAQRAWEPPLTDSEAEAAQPAA